MAGTQPFCPRPGFQKRLGQPGQMPSDEILNSGAKLRRILRRIGRRKGSKSSILFLRTPLKSLAFPVSRFLC